MIKQIKKRNVNAASEEPDKWSGSGEQPSFEKLTTAQILHEELRKVASPVSEENAIKLEDESDLEFQTYVISFYDRLIEKSSIDKFFSMILLLANVAQSAPIPQKTLITISTPYHVRLLLELMTVVSPKSKLKIVKILDSLIKNKIPL